MFQHNWCQHQKFSIIMQLVSKKDFFSYSRASYIVVVVVVVYQLNYT
jgi:hypothetical protein